MRVCVCVFSAGVGGGCVGGLFFFFLHIFSQVLGLLEVCQTGVECRKRAHKYVCVHVCV